MVIPPEVSAIVMNRLFMAAAVFILGSTLGYVTGEVNRRLLERAGVSDAVDGTAFERTMQGLGTSTVNVIAKLSMWFIIGISLLAALSIAGIWAPAEFWTEFTRFIPTLFVAVLVLISGIVIGDKLQLILSERLRGVKFPQITILPRLVKYSVVYVAGLIALSQIGVAISALLILLAVYAFGIVFIGGIALKDFLAAGAAGMYLIFTQPYSIGDEIKINDREGIVQEITTFVTRVENNNEEYVIPNHHIFQYGITRKRQY
jgi:small-conductance mechanosensitive channel